MERIDKIFTILVMMAFVAFLVHGHKRRGIASVHMNTSASPCDGDRGPAYLLSALPIHRRQDDYADPVSYYEGNELQPPTWGI
jgi:hypothetical protein